MSRYSGLLVNIKYIFLHYVTLSDSCAFLAVVSGTAITILFFILLFIRIDKRYLNTLVFLSLLPLCIGTVGTIYTVIDTKEAVKIESKQGKGPSAKKYYNLEYIYSQTLLRSFPMLAGAVSSVMPMILIVALKRRNDDER